MPVLGGDVAVRRFQLPAGDEFLDLVNGHRRVDQPAGTGVLAALVADAAADGGEGVILLDKGQRLVIAALGGHLYVALNGDVGRAGGLAGGGAGVIAVFLVVVPVVIVPHVLAPAGCFVGQGLPGIADRPVLAAELLAQLGRA